MSFDHNLHVEDYDVARATNDENIFRDGLEKVKGENGHGPTSWVEALLCVNPLGHVENLSGKLRRRLSVPVSGLMARVMVSHTEEIERADMLP